MMRKLLFILVLFLMGLPYAYAESTKPVEAPVTGKPKVEIVNQSYTFAKVMDGTRVNHDFIIRNTGNSTLDIQSVKPG